MKSATILRIHSIISSALDLAVRYDWADRNVALRENRFDFARQQVRLARNYLVKNGQHIEKAPKDGEGRVLSLDLLTCELLRERFQRRRAEAKALGSRYLTTPSPSHPIRQGVRHGTPTR